MATKMKEEAVSVMEISRGILDFCILGTTPFIYNAMSQKVKQGLLLPSGRKTAADKAGSLKHDPVEEYRTSVYRMDDPSAPTLLKIPATFFKGAIGNAALILPGTKKAEIGRLVHVHGIDNHMYGTPKLFMSIVRSADMNKTPDVRTRAMLPEWACKVSLTFIKPILREQIIIDLMAMAGQAIGVGDFRSEKGKGNYGSFEIVNADNPDFLRVMKQGRDVQEDGLKNWVCADSESEELMHWYESETKRRGFKVAA